MDDHRESPLRVMQVGQLTLLWNGLILLYSIPYEQWLVRLITASDMRTPVAVHPTACSMRQSRNLVTRPERTTSPEPTAIPSHLQLIFSLQPIPLSSFPFRPCLHSVSSTHFVSCPFRAR